VGLCDDFKSWSELNTILNESQAISTNTTLISIHPSEPIQLTSDLNITRLMSCFYDIDMETNDQDIEMTFDILGISGIDFMLWPMIAKMRAHLKVGISFEQSRIEFYRNGTLLTDNQCSAEMIYKYRDNTNTFFKLFKDITFKRQNTYPENSICPYLFSATNLNSLSIYSLADSVVVSNLWIFKSVDTNETTMNSRIYWLNLAGYGFDLDTGLMHPLVFESVQSLFIYRSIESIQVDLFKHFSQMSYVRLRMDCVINFVHKIGFAWTTSLAETSQSWIELSKYVEDYASWIDGSEYLYPNEDFCVFAQYPQRNFLVYILHNRWTLTDCTSTIQFLVSNYGTQDTTQLFYNFPDAELIYSICKNSSNRTVDFAPMISNCNMTHFKASDSTHAEYYQVAYIFEFVEDLLVFIVIPLTCALGLFLNVLAIRAVHQNQEKGLKDDFYQYMSLNAKFNCLYCIIFLFYPVNSCVDGMTGYFCSSIHTSYITQLYKIVLVSFFGETFKMCSNIMYILMNVNRYMLIGRDHNRTFDIISKWNMNSVIIVTVFISLLANVAHAFQYELHNAHFYKFFYDTNYMYIYPSYPIIDYTSTALDVYLIVYFIFNFLLFFVVNTAVEAVLVRKLHTELADKKARLEKLAANSRKSSAAAEPMSFRKKRKLDIGGEDRAACYHYGRDKRTSQLFSKTARAVCYPFIAV
jgi:hypothetical protein